MATERRRYVRVRPAADYDVRVQMTRDGITELLQVVDLGTGGFGLFLEGPLLSLSVGDVIQLKVILPGDTVLEAAAAVKHATQSKGVCGVELTELDEEGAALMRRTVSELLARGNAI